MYTLQLSALITSSGIVSEYEMIDDSSVKCDKVWTQTCNEGVVIDGIGETKREGAENK